MTSDVISLHTSIPHEFGIEAIDYFLSKYQGDLHSTIKKIFCFKISRLYTKKQHADI